MNAFRAKQHAKSRIDLLPPEPKTPAGRHARRPSARLEVVDADFVVIRAASPRTTNDNRKPLRPAGASGHILLRAAAACGRVIEAGLQRLPGRAFAGVVTALFIFVFAYAGGLSALKAALPAAAAGETLHVADVTATLDDQNGMKVLAVYGRVHNAGSDAKDVPPVDIVIAAGDGNVERRFALEASSLAAGESGNFSLRIPHAGGKVPKVSVSLAGKGASIN